MCLLCYCLYICGVYKLPRACTILDYILQTLNMSMYYSLGYPCTGLCSSKLVVFGEMPFIHILIVIKQCHVTCDGNTLGLPVHTNTDKFVIDHSMTILAQFDSVQFLSKVLFSHMVPC